MLRLENITEKAQNVTGKHIFWGAILSTKEAVMFTLWS